MYNDADIEMAEAYSIGRRVDHITSLGQSLNVLQQHAITRRVAEALWEGWLESTTEGVLIELEDAGIGCTQEQFNTIVWEAWDAYQAKEEAFDLLRD